MAERLSIICVKWGRQFGPAWVDLMFAMVRRHLPQGTECDFLCFTDDASGLEPYIEARPLPGNLNGWWNKLYLFKDGAIPHGTRVVYFDLDTLILGSLAPLLAYRGRFAILRDFYRPEGYGSGVMLWHAGGLGHIWESYEAAGRPEIAGGDQAWIERSSGGAELLQDLYPDLFASYKEDCRPLPPPPTRIVCFHGDPKQDDCGAPWVREIWRNGAALADLPYKTREEEMEAHARHAISLPYPWLAEAQAHSRQAVIVAGGPSLDDCAEALAEHHQAGHTVFAVNHSAGWLKEQAIDFTAHVITGMRAEQTGVTAGDDPVTRYYASTCPPAVLAGAHDNTVIWHPAAVADLDIVRNDSREIAPVAGCTAGLSSIHLAHRLGYRRFHLYGFDSSYSETGRSHAPAQPENETDRRLVATFAQRRFSAAAWMMKQAREFFLLADGLIQDGCDFTVCGEGLLPFMAMQAMKPGTGDQGPPSF